MRRIFQLLAVFALTAAAALVPSSSFAHAELVASTPAAGATVAAGVIDIDLTFGEDLMKSEDSQGSAVQITDDSTGETAYVDCVYVSGAHLYAKAAIYADGPVTLTWRTVADDGHALSDSYTFTVTNPNGDTLGDTTGFCPEGQVYAPNEVAVMKYDSMPAPKAAKQTSSDNGMLVGLGIGVVIVFLFALLGAIQTKRRWAKEDAEAAKTKKKK